MSRTFSKRTEIRSLVRERADGHCEICGVQLNKNAPATEPNHASMHHRFRRAKGGIDTVSNLLRLCRFCHVFRIHGDEETAERYGWLLPDDQSSKHPVLTRHGWVYLHEDGTMSEVPWWKEPCPPLAIEVTAAYRGEPGEGEDVAL